MSEPDAWQVWAVGVVESALTDLADAPRQPDEGAPSAVLRLRPEYAPALDGLRAGDRVVVITWLHLADRGTLVVHPRDDVARPPTGVFATRSAQRPNPVGLHEATVVAVSGTAVTLDALEAVDGTPVLDVKPALGPRSTR